MVVQNTYRVLAESELQMDPKTLSEYRSFKTFLAELSSKMKHGVKSPGELLPEILDAITDIQRPLTQIIQSYSTGLERDKVAPVQEGLDRALSLSSRLRKTMERHDEKESLK